MELSLTVKNQIRKGMASTKPGFQIIGSAQDQESDDEPTQKISAYATCEIEGVMAEAIIDTGARGCIMSKHLLDRLGWHINKRTNQTFITADGTTAVPLGKVTDVPVQF